MKKVITIMFFIFFVNLSNAQDLTKKFNESAKQDLETLKSIVKIDENQNQLLKGFFYKKHKLYSIQSNTEARKKEIQRELEAELKSYFNAVETRKLENNKKLLLKLVSE